jgi:hypothetical protein
MKRGIKGPKLHLCLVVGYHLFYIIVEDIPLPFFSYFVENSDKFVQRRIVSISHDTGNQRFRGSAVLDQIKKMKIRLMRNQDQE